MRTRVLAGLAVTALLLGACSQRSEDVIANYQVDASPDKTAAALLQLATTPSRLGRLGAKRPAVASGVEHRGGERLVTISVPGAGGNAPVVLTLAVTALYGEESGKSMVAVSLSAPDAGEIDLGPRRFASARKLGNDFGEAVGMLPEAATWNRPRSEAQHRFGRLLDLAAVIDDPDLLAKVEKRGKQPGAVDYLFFDDPPPAGFGA